MNAMKLRSNLVTKLAAGGLLLASVASVFGDEPRAGMFAADPESSVSAAEFPAFPRGCCGSIPCPAFEKTASVRPVVSSVDEACRCGPPSATNCG